MPSPKEIKRRKKAILKKNEERHRDNQYVPPSQKDIEKRKAAILEKYRVRTGKPNMSNTTKPKTQESTISPHLLGLNTAPVDVDNNTITSTYFNKKQKKTRKVGKPPKQHDFKKPPPTLHERYKQLGLDSLNTVNVNGKTITPTYVKKKPNLQDAMSDFPTYNSANPQAAAGRKKKSKKSRKTRRKSRKPKRKSRKAKKSKRSRKTRRRRRRRKR